MKLVSNQISPNLKAGDVIKAVFSPYTGIDSNFEQFFCTKNYILANTARTCLGIIADVVNPKKKIGMPAFICGVVATPFLARGHKIEWIDTDENGLIDVADLEKKAPQIDLLVVPHIFGQHAPLKDIMSVAKAHDIFVVEDGAHLIRQFEPGYRPIANAQILSFGREKVISCVSGGALIWPEDSPFHDKFSNVKLASSHFLWTLKHLSQPMIFSLALPWWQKGGKIIPFIFRKINWLPLAVSPAEKKGQEDCPQASMSRSIQKLLIQQYKKQPQTAVHQQAMALAWETQLKTTYKKEHIVRPANAFRVILKAITPDDVKSLKGVNGFHLEDWNGVPISPNGVELAKFGYKLGSCPQAEKFAQSYVTFPTNQRVQKRDINVFAKSWQDA